MYKSKGKYSRGQKQQTRSLNLLTRVEERIKATASKYRQIREALVALSVPLVQLTWVQSLRTLEDSDLVGLTSMDDFGSEGRKKLSWIWSVEGTGGDVDSITQAALRIEWSKARARAHRWQEECLLLREEMRRVLAFFSWQAEDWDRIAQDHADKSLNGSDNIIRFGKVAYASLQATIRRRMKIHCENKWDGISSKLGTLNGMVATAMIECH